MKLRWTIEAEVDRITIIDLIATDDPRAVAAMDQRFSDAVSPLIQFPQLGRVGIIPGTRELFPDESYRLVYEVDGDTVWVLALVHSARAWPPGADDL